MAKDEFAYIDSVDEETDGAARKQSLEDQEEAAWNDICNGFIKTVYAARENYSKALIRADTNQLLQRSKADDVLAASIAKPADSGLGFAFAASNHARAVHKLEEDYLRANVHAVAQFKNDVEAASVYLSQRAINIVSAGNQ